MTVGFLCYDIIVVLIRLEEIVFLWLYLSIENLTCLNQKYKVKITRIDETRHIYQALWLKYIKTVLLKKIYSLLQINVLKILTVEVLHINGKLYLYILYTQCLRRVANLFLYCAN